MKYQQNLQFKIYRTIIFVVGIIFCWSGIASSQSSYMKIARSLEQQHEYEQALSVYQKIYSTNKNDINVIRGIKNCYQGLQQNDQLIIFLQNAQKFSPSNLYVPSYLGEAYYQINERDQAMRIWKGHIESHAKDIAVYRVVASSMIAMRMFDDAIEVYKLALVNIKSQFNLHMDIANLYKLQLKYAEATDHLLQFYIHSPKQFTYIQRQILILADDQDQLSDIIETIDRYTETYPDLTQINELHANLHIKANEFEPAFKIYQQLEDDKSKGSYLAKFAAAAQSNHAYDYTLKAYETIQQRFPESPFALNAPVNIANAYKLLAYQNRASGKFESAGMEIQRAIDIYDSLTVNPANLTQQSNSHNQLGEIYAQYYFDLDKSIFHYKKYIALQRKGIQSDAGLIKLGNVYLQKNLLSEADKTYNSVVTKEYKPIASFKSAEITYFQGQFKKALKKLSTLQNTTSIQNGIYNDILEKKQVIESFAKDSVHLQQYAQAELLVFQQKNSEAAEILSNLARKENKLSTLAGRLAGKLYLELDQPENTRDLMQFLSEKYKDDIHVDEILFYLARSEEFLGEYSRALDVYTTLIIEHSTSLYISEARQQARLMKEQIDKEEI